MQTFKELSLQGLENVTYYSVERNFLKSSGLFIQ